MIPVFMAMLLLNSLEAAPQADSVQKPDSLRGPLTLRILPQNFYTTCLPYTCKKEIQLQKITRLPFYFRLGSKEYVDYLEEKNRCADMQICRYANVKRLRF
jgi:hypothetical protein